MDIYETRNSRYEVDLPNLRYRRTALGAQYEPSSAPMEYDDWLPLKDVPDNVQLTGDVSDPYKAPEQRFTILLIQPADTERFIITSPITFVAMGVDA